MGNICSDNQREMKKVKLQIKSKEIVDLNESLNKTDIYNHYCRIYMNYDIFTTKELFKESFIGICRVIDVYDGDTIKISLNFIEGNDNIYKFSVRLSGVDTPEIKTNNPEEKIAAIKARNKLLSMIIEGGINKSVNLEREIDEKISSTNIKTILTNDVYLAKIITLGFDKYGRLLAEIYPYTSNDNTTSYNKLLIEDKYAYKYDGGTKQKFQQ